MIHEFQQIVRAYGETDFGERKAALATVVRLAGSAYRRPGARMLITDDGRWTGAISGGCLEGDALRKAREVMGTGQPRVVTYDTTEESGDAFGIGLGCNGIIDVLLEPIHPADPANPVHLLSRLLVERTPAVMATVIGSEQENRVGQRLVREPNGDVHVTFTDQRLARRVLQLADAAAATERSSVDVLGDVTVFVEVFQPDIQLVVFGAGYDAVPLVNLAKLVGWSVTVTDDCVAHLSPKKFAACDALRMVPREADLAELPLTRYAAAVLMSHNFAYDRAVLPKLLATSVPYIGLLGPKKRADQLLDAIGGVRASDYARIHAPIGLDLGAETPEEIALSIVAEIRAAFSQRSGQMLRHRNAPIH
jgi:xanthine/CO dehydrogenase XdhC/CoxF family maturation factor